MTLIALALTVATSALPCGKSLPASDNWTLPPSEDPASLQSQLYTALSGLFESDPDGVDPTLRVQAAACGEGATMAVVDDGENQLSCRRGVTLGVVNYECRLSLVGLDSGWSSAEKSFQEILFRAVASSVQAESVSAQDYVRLVGPYSGAVEGSLQCTTRADADGRDQYRCEFQL